MTLETISSRRRTSKEFAMITAHGYAVHEAGAPLAPWEFQRREPGPDDVQIEILYTGICHIDLHQATDHWSGGIFGRGDGIFPMPGYQKPEKPVCGPIAPTDRFRAAVQEAKIGPDKDIPHVMPEVIVKYVTDLQLICLL
jgi:hypothetical protein